MGVQQMGKIAAANFLRKMMQLILLVLLFHWMEFDVQMSIFIAICTLVGSDLIVLLYLFHMFVLQMRTLKKKEQAPMGGKEIRRSLLSVSLPTTGMRVFHAVTNAIEPFFIKWVLLKSGMTEGMANEHFGLVAGVAFTIGFFPAFIAHSLSTVLIPTVASAGDDDDVSLRASGCHCHSGVFRAAHNFVFPFGCRRRLCPSVMAVFSVSLFCHSDAGVFNRPRPGQGCPRAFYLVNNGYVLPHLLSWLKSPVPNGRRHHRYEYGNIAYHDDALFNDL